MTQSKGIIMKLRETWQSASDKPELIICGLIRL